MQPLDHPALEVDDARARMPGQLEGRDDRPRLLERRRRGREGRVRRRDLRRMDQRLAVEGHARRLQGLRIETLGVGEVVPDAVEHADAALVVDNSGTQPIDVALKADGQLQQLATNPPAWVAEKLVKPYHEREVSRGKIEKAFETQCAGGNASLPAVLTDADASNGKTYRGKIIEVTAQHALQQTGANKFVVHDRTLSASQALEKGKQATIGYAYDKGKIVAPALDKGTPSKNIGR